MRFDFSMAGYPADKEIGVILPFSLLFDLADSNSLF
jgi:hypothetical protein